MGAVDAGRVTADRVLRANVSVAVYPGGSKEIFETRPELENHDFACCARSGSYARHQPRPLGRCSWTSRSVQLAGEPARKCGLAVALVTDPARPFWGQLHLVPAEGETDGGFRRADLDPNTTDVRDDGRDAFSDDARFAARVDRLHAEVLRRGRGAVREAKAEAAPPPRGRRR